MSDWGGSVFERSVGVAAGLVVAIAISTSAKADGYFDGAYFGITNPPPKGVVRELLGGDGGDELGFNFGFAGGLATYNVLESAGILGTAGDSFTVPMLRNELGAPIGAFFGYRWQNDWRVVGLEAYLHSSTVNHDWTDVPGANPSGAEFRLKTHWVGTVTGTAGAAFGRLLLYGQAGLAHSHYVLDFDYDANPGDYIRTAQARLGVAFGAGFELALTQRLSLGLGYRAYILSPYRVTFGSEDLVVQAAAHSVTARLIYSFGASERLQNWTEPFDWGGWYVGNYLGVLWQLGGTIGYDWTFGRNLAGLSFRAGVALCCGLSYDFEASARIGRVLGDNVLVYAKATAATQTGTFFDVDSGPYYSAGLGLEIALAPHVTGFTEWRAIGAPGLGFADGYITAGFNFHFGQ